MYERRIEKSEKIEVPPCLCRKHRMCAT